MTRKLTAAWLSVVWLAASLLSTASPIFVCASTFVTCPGPGVAEFVESSASGHASCCEETLDTAPSTAPSTPCCFSIPEIGLDCPVPVGMKAPQLPLAVEASPAWLETVPEFATEERPGAIAAPDPPPRSSLCAPERTQVFLI